MFEKSINRSETLIHIYQKKMKSQQLRLFIRNYISEQNDSKSHTVERFMNRYAKEFGVDISYLETGTLHIQLNEEDITPIEKKEITFDILLLGISQGYLNNKTIDTYGENPDSPVKLKFTAKQIIIGILIVVISSILLGIIAIYT